MAQSRYLNFYAESSLRATVLEYEPTIPAKFMIGTEQVTFSTDIFHRKQLRSHCWIVEPIIPAKFMIGTEQSVKLSQQFTLTKGATQK